MSARCRRSKPRCVALHVMQIVSAACLGALTLLQLQAKVADASRMPIVCLCQIVIQFDATGDVLARSSLLHTFTFAAFQVSCS